MKILALDSTAVTAAVAVCEDEKLLASYTVNNGNTHSETLLPMIESMLGQLRMTVRDIDLFVCSAGPGSFTGVRIGVSTIKGLAFAADADPAEPHGKSKPCVGVSTLEVLSLNLRGTGFADSLICPVMNARRGQVYNALFEADGSSPSGIKRLCEDRLITVAALDDELAESYAGRKVFLCGDGYDIALSMMKRTAPESTPEPLRYQSGYSVAVCGLNAYKAGSFTDDLGLKPVYLRPSQAERELAEKLAGTSDTAK